MINEETKAIIDKFLESKIYPRIIDKDNLLGVIVYGSATTGYFDKTIRGVKFIDGTKIEYFIKPIEKFLSESVAFTNSNCPSHIALNQNASILYGQEDFLKNILNADNQFYNQNHKKPNINFEQKIVQIENRIASLDNIYNRNGKEFDMVYYNILEMIRTTHSAHTGEADIPFNKAYRIYTEEKYYDKYVGKNASNPKPDQKFIDLYKNCVEKIEDKKTMLNNIHQLYDYEKSHYSINPKDYEITL